MPRRICLFVATAVVAAALVAGSAGAVVTPLKANVVSSFASSLDGTDLYSVDIAEGSSGDWILKRRSLADGSVLRLARFTGEYFPDIVLAGGGYVYLGMTADGFETEDSLGTRTKIVRVSRDGAVNELVAAGRIPAEIDNEVVVRNNKAYLNDCGTSVELEAVSPQGAAAITETTQDRESAKCGNLPNVDHVQVNEVSPLGVRRLIYSYDTKIRKKIKVKRGHWIGDRNPVFEGVYSVSLFGDHAAFAMGRNSRSYVRDLATGMFSGPYKTTLPGRASYQFATLDPIGRMALLGYTFKRTKRKDIVKFEVGLVRTPGDPASYVRVSRSSLLAYCATHLVKIGPKSVVELDPQTLAPLRTIFERKSLKKSEVTCGGDYLYETRYSANSDTYFTYFLG